MDVRTGQQPDSGLKLELELPLDVSLSGKDDTRMLSNAAKFKASQDLRIQTVDLPETRTSKQTCSGRSSRVTPPGTESASSTTVTPKTPATSTGKKRQRRTAAQIDRRFPCTYPGCTKAYGSEGSLTQHQRLKHRNQVLDTRHAHANNQVGSLLIPLHRAPRSAPGASSYRSGVPLPNIRPANMIDAASILPLQFDVPNGVLGADQDELLLAGDMAATPHGQQLRARSNSMPISFSASHNVLQYSLGMSSREGPRRPRKARPGSTPGPKSMRRNAKARSRSESLTGLAANDGIGLGLSDRSMSDPIMFHPGNGIEWGVAEANHHTPPSGSDEAIDSDILSVLADYDSSDAGDSSMEFADPRSFLAATLPTTMEPTAVLDSLTSTEDAVPSSSTFNLGDEWTGNLDAVFLSSHLEKMSMVQEAGTADLEQMEDASVLDSGGMGSLPDQFTSVSIVTPPPPTSQAPHSTSATFTTFPVHDSDPLWEKADLSEPEFMGDVDLDDAIFLVPESSLDATSTWKMDKLYGAFPLLDDSFFLESGEAVGANEARLGSPVLGPTRP